MENAEATRMFDYLIWGGAGLTLLGLALLVWCILRVMKAKRARLADAEMREVVRAVLPLNLGALMMSMFGLMLVIVGVLLG